MNFCLQNVIRVVSSKVEANKPGFRKVRIKIHIKDKYHIQNDSSQQSQSPAKALIHARQSRVIWRDNERLLHNTLRPSSHGGAIVPFYLRANFWNGQIGCSHENERLRTNFALCSDGNAIVPLTCFPFACSDGNGTERLRIVPLFALLF